LNAVEQGNLKVLQDEGLEIVPIFITVTGLRKSILDATIPFRFLLSRHGIHDFEMQATGRSEHGVSVGIRIVEDSAVHAVSASFYRPETKKGDPRFWPSRLGRFASAGDVIAAFVHEATLHLLNLSRTKLQEHRALGVASEALNLVSEIAVKENAIGDELAVLLRGVATRGPIRSVIVGDAAVGWAVEKALGIQPNPNKRPDYKGIEIKAGRGTVNRSNLFAQVPDWSLSPYKSSLAILKKCGYVRDGRLQLYCEMRTTKANGQDLRLRVTDRPPWLIEYLDRNPIEDIAVWPLALLHGRLLEKHPETFWIKAQPVIKEGVEHFVLKSAVHTRRPSVAAFDKLLIEGAISVDHVSRLVGKTAGERGPSFKVDEDRRGELFIGRPREFVF
jgi:hypothetical protein